MRKKDKYEFYNDDADENAPSYDFSTVNLRSEGHVEGFYDDIESFSFDGDSYGELSFEEDEELLEEDFLLESESDDDEDVDFNDTNDAADEDTEDSFIDNGLFDFGEPDKTPDDNDALFDDNIEEDGNDAAKDSEEVTTYDNTTDNSSSSDNVHNPIKPKQLRSSALQPLLVIKKSKHSFSTAKKEKNQNADVDVLKVREDFDSFDDTTMDTHDDDIEDMSDTLKMNTEIIPEVDAEEKESNTDVNISEEISEELVPTDELDSDYISADDTVAEVISEDAADIGIDEEEIYVPEEFPSVEVNEKAAEPAEPTEKAEPVEPAEPVSIDVVQNEDEATESVQDGADNSGNPVFESDNSDVINDTAEEKNEVPAESEKKKAEEKKLLRKKKKRKKMVKNLFREIISWALLVAAAFVIAIVVNLYVARPSIVSGESMMPTLNNGDTIVISKIPYMLGDVEYGDIIVIDRQAERERTFAVELKESLKYNSLTQSLFDKNELSDDTFWVKRIIGKPGDVIEFADGKVYRNGEMLVEDYILTQEVDTYMDGQQVIVKEGCIFVMGDNRNASLDSRALAMRDEQIEIDHIVGKLISK